LSLILFIFRYTQQWSGFRRDMFVPYLAMNYFDRFISTGYRTLKVTTLMFLFSFSNILSFYLFVLLLYVKIELNTLWFIEG